KLLAFGADTLSEAELLALILRTGLAGQTVDALAREIVERFGSLRALAGAPLAAICGIRGVGPAKAAALIAAVEIARRLVTPRDLDEPIHDSLTVFERCRTLAWLDAEQLLVFALDARNRVLHRFCVARGSLLGCGFRPRDLFAPLIRLPVRAAILVHNHPSGDPTPSGDDVELTRRVVEAGRLLGIEVLDHIVVGDGCYESLRDRGDI
ncbi:MAG: DNA repair protein RadC, partial [Myxococcales bacterium]|nr:DNA repair protein RadC [Myxococcales bacterium]